MFRRYEPFDSFPFIALFNSPHNINTLSLQLYLLWRPASVAQPVLQLYGFKKVLLEPGETKYVNLTLDVERYFSSYNRDHEWVV